MLAFCTSGGNDGRWVDAGIDNTWPNFAHDNVICKTQAFTVGGGVGAAGTNYNLFKITGGVRVFNIYGTVTTLTPGTNSLLNLELYSTNASVDITNAAGAPDLINRCVGTQLSKQSASTDPLEIGEPDATPAIIENASSKSPEVPITLIKDDAADTYIQMQLSVALASGEIIWCVTWEPTSTTGFLEPA